ncbi:MAG: ABC transporter substrate-binding protein, partial [Thermomicrobiales bacterium]
MSSPSQPGTLTRRQVGLATLAGGLGLTRIPTTSAQSPEATPGASPVPGHFTTVSPTREDVLATLRATYPIQPPGNDGGDVITGYTLDISTLNPLLRSDFESGYVTNLIYESLVNASPIDGSPIPMLADSWDLSEDGVTWRFHLNPNATWQDGKLVTADDVVFSFDAALAEDGFSPIRTAISGMLARYEKLDDHTIDFTATGQLATFLEQTVMQVSIMPKHIWGDVPFSEWPSDGGTTGSDPARIVGSGPFTFVEWVQN